MHVGRLELVDADQRDHVAERGQEISVRGDVRADVGEGVDAHAQKPPVGVERELGVGDVVPRVLVGEDRLAPLARPLDGPAKLARRPQHQLVLGILPALGAEGAADVAGDDADPVLGDLEDAAGQGVADAMRVLDVGVEGVAVLDRIVDAERAPRLQVLRVDPRDDVAASDDPVSPGEGRLGRRAVAGLEDVADVVGTLVPHRRGAGLGGLRGRGHRRQRLVVDLDEVGRVLGLGAGLGDDERDRVAHVPHAVAGETPMGAGEHRRAVRALALERHGHRAEAVDVGAGEDGEDAGRAPRRRRVDRAEPRVRVQRAHDHGVRLEGDVDVVEVATASLQEPDVLDPLDALPDPELPHRRSPPYGCRRAPGAANSFGHTTIHLPSCTCFTFVRSSP